MQKLTFELHKTCSHLSAECPPEDTEKEVSKLFSSRILTIHKQIGMGFYSNIFIGSLNIKKKGIPERFAVKHEEIKKVTAKKKEKRKKKKEKRKIKKKTYWRI